MSFVSEEIVPKIDVNAAAREHFARIHRAALMLSGNPWDADDLAQETFLVLSRQESSFHGRSSLYTWLYGILLNLERRQRRQQGMSRRKLQVVWNDETARPARSPAAETPLEAREWKQSLWSYVARLPDGQRQALVLRFSEGLRYEEIGEVLDCPVGTVKSRMFHALLALRKMMAEESPGALGPPAFPNEDMTHVI